MTAILTEATMKPPKSLPIGKVANSNNGRSKRKRGAFGEPVDDTFRHYMSRKIALQRRQFGLHVPPPPSPPASQLPPPQSPPCPRASQSPNQQQSPRTQQCSSKIQVDDDLSPPRRRNHSESESMNRESRDKNSNPVPQFSSNSQPRFQRSPQSSYPRVRSVCDQQKDGDKGEADSPGDEELHSSPSAPLHSQRTNNSADSALSLSQILIQLKRRHGNGRDLPKQRNCGKKISSKRKSTPGADNFCATPKITPDWGGKQSPKDNPGSSSPPNNCDSVLGILSSLEKRHGDSSSFSYRKRRRKSSKSKVTFSPIIDTNSSTQKGNQCAREKRKNSKSVLENLQSIPQMGREFNSSSVSVPPYNSMFHSFGGKISADETPITDICATWQSSPEQNFSQRLQDINKNVAFSDASTVFTRQLNYTDQVEAATVGEERRGRDEGHVDLNSNATPCLQQNQLSTASTYLPKSLQTNQRYHTSLAPLSPCQSTVTEQHNKRPTTLTAEKSTSNGTSTPSNHTATQVNTKLRPDLFFTGIVVLINGYTDPDGTTLLRLLQKHNGDVEKYETPRVTHIIAQQLSTAKVNIYKKQRKPIPVVKPDWIVESVKAGKLLDYRDYLIDDVKESRSNNRSVKSFFGVEKELTKKKAEVHSSNRDQHEPISSEIVLDSHDLSLLNDFRSNNQCQSTNPAMNSQHNEKSPPKINHDPNPSTLNGQIQDHTNNSPTTNQTLNHPQTSSSPNKVAENGSYRWSDQPPSKSNYLINGQIRTVGNDPNFLESYFSNSRLSYIGSFKQRVKTNSANPSISQSKCGSKRFVLLVDMDCFFANVALRKFPQYRDKPVAVGHSTSNKSDPLEFASRSKNSSSELSTCNYIARKFGLRKGMFLGDAIQLCPDLIVLPYDFESFEEVSAIVAEVLHEYAGKYNGYVEVVSCDEAYVEIYLEPENFIGNDVYSFLRSIAEDIRKDIFKHTECTASVGVGQNKLLAKLGADRVKPDACCVVKEWRHFLDGLSLRKIPGVGHKFQKRLEPLGITDVNNVWDLGDDAEKVLGEIIGQGNARKIVKFCHGEDSRPVTPGPRKSIGAECNYGVRFNGPYGVDYMMMGLAKEVEKRMATASVRGSKITLKVMKSKDATKMPGKFLGHGSCVNLSKSSDIPLTRDCDIISKTGMKLFERLEVDKDLVRGMGIMICSLKSDNFAPANSHTTKLSGWLTRDEGKMTAGMDSSTDEPNAAANKESDGEQSTASQSVPKLLDGNGSIDTLPSFSQLDESVLRELPRDILHEVKSTYGSVPSNCTALKSLPLIDSQLNHGGDVFDIPSMSQIDLDEVMELPPDICHAILEQIGNKVEDSKPAANDATLPLSDPKRPLTNRIFNQSIPIAGQVSVKRMLKLVSIKSGEESHSEFRLSQLDCLPLETQLQIVNGDDVVITKQGKKSAKSTEKSKVILEEDSTVECAVQNEIQHYQPSTRELFYVENILPLKNYIAAHPRPSSDEADFVKQFLYLCVMEYRYDDTIALLRAMKTMQNGWDELVYAKIRDEIVVNIFDLSRNRLDIKRLRL